MHIRTRVFELARELGLSDRELAARMGISDAQISRVRSGQRRIHGDFLLGARRAFPDKPLDELFSVEDDRQEVPA